jgi:type IV secretion system protein VirD4
VRELPAEDELIFVTGFKPMRVKKARYYTDAAFLTRVLPPPNQSQRLNLPDRPQFDWLRERAKGPQLQLPRERSRSREAGSQPAEADDEEENDMWPDGHVTDV